jgi:hypothetical protein
MKSRFLFVAVLYAAASLSACNKETPVANTASGIASPGSQPSSAPASINDVRNALDQKNFGQATVIANQLVATNANDIEAWIADADANAAAGNRLAALTAISNALSHGLQDTNRLDSDTYLADLRNSDEYRRLLSQHGLTKPVAATGDTSISTTDSGTVVRAGDVSVTLPNDKN